MKRTLLCALFGLTHIITFSQYHGHTEAERNLIEQRRTEAGVKMKTVQVTSIDDYTGKVKLGKLSYEKYTRDGYLAENGIIVDGTELIGIKRFYNEKNELIKQEHYSQENRLYLIRYWEYDSLGHVVFEKDSAVNYRSKNLVTDYEFLNDSCILGVTTGHEKTYVEGNMSERVIPSTFILFENNDLKVTRGTMNPDGTMGDAGTILEFNEQGERVSYSSCSRQVLNHLAGNYCSEYRNIYNDAGLITHTESTDVKGRTPRDVSQHWYTYNANDQLLEIKTQKYSNIERREFEWNSKGQITVMRFLKEQLSSDYNHEIRLTYNEKGILIKEQYYSLNTLKLNGEIDYTYEYF